MGWLGESGVVGVFSVAVTGAWDQGAFFIFSLRAVSGFGFVISAGAFRAGWCPAGGLVSGFPGFSGDVGRGVVFAGGRLVAGLSLYGVWALS